MQTATARKLNNKTIGDEFEQSFLYALMAAGHYVQQMPPRVGYDFSVGFYGNGDTKPFELKYVFDGRLRLKHFTAIEIRVAEEMTEKGIKYYVAYPLLSGFGVTTWSRIRRQLLGRETVVLDQAKAVMWLPSKEFMEVTRG
jgi:hypothetical protein